MAESAVSLQTVTPNSLRETESLLQCDQEAPTSTLPCHCGQRYRARRVRSKGAVLVIVWILLTWACSTIVNAVVIFQSLVLKIINGLGTAVLYLFAGWLTDVYFGRYKVIKVSIWVVVGECWWHSFASDSPLISTWCTEVCFSSSCLHSHCHWIIRVDY